ncbi:hypothetical protein BDIM_04830 [Brevundimonas diminuta ATCC 11568]|nr:hypothetical protein BDIM_04830 [Brevundimonas diminuta ATCC 11568]
MGSRTNSIASTTAPTKASAGRAPRRLSISLAKRSRKTWSGWSGKTKDGGTFRMPPYGQRIGYETLPAGITAMQPLSSRSAPSERLQRVRLPSSAGPHCRFGAPLPLSSQRI